MDLQYTEIIFNTQMQYGKKKKKKIHWKNCYTTYSS